MTWSRRRTRSLKRTPSNTPSTGELSKSPLGWLPSYCVFDSVFEETMFRDKVSEMAEPGAEIVIMVLGAGRGPLVAQCRAAIKVNTSIYPDTPKKIDCNCRDWDTPR